MNHSVKKIVRAYFASKLRWAVFWFVLVCLLCYWQIEMFYGPWISFIIPIPALWAEFAVSIWLLFLSAWAIC